MVALNTAITNAHSAMRHGAAGAGLQSIEATFFTHPFYERPPVYGAFA